MSKKHSVLIIDDAPMMLRLLNNILKDEYEIMIAKCGDQGVEFAKKHMPDIILLDLMMPQISGFDVLASLKNDEATMSIPFLLITGSDSREDEERGYDLGAVDYIKKPFVDGIVKHRIKFNIEHAAMSHILRENGLSIT